MTEFKFPDPQPIDWDALEEGNEVWIRTVCKANGALEISKKRGNKQHHALCLSNDLGYHISGHVIKPPKPLAAGDKVRVKGKFSVYEIIAFDGNMAWLRHTSTGERPYRESVELANLVRVEQVERLRKEVDAARLAERAKIVAWLRDDALSHIRGGVAEKALLGSATDIEAGEHLK